MPAAMPNVEESKMRDIEHVIEHVETIVIGAGQAGLSVGYLLAQRGRPFVILEANARVGDTWRRRWDSLRLFTPARYAGLVGMPFPGPRHHFPTKDEMADYLERYAATLALPVRTGIRVRRVSRPAAHDGGRFLVETHGRHGDRRYWADHVVVAMANYQTPRVPAFAAALDPAIGQLHSSAYRNPAQLEDDVRGPVLVVGAGNSGAEIALELARAGRTVTLAGRAPGQLPFRIDGLASRLVLQPLLLRGVFHRLLTTRTPIGRRVRTAALARGAGTPLIRLKARDLAAAGVARAPRVVGVRDGRPLLDAPGTPGGQPIDVAHVVWCTGFEPGFSWLDLPAFDPTGHPVHARGVAPGVPGLYFVGLHFLHAMSSSMIHGVGRDAAHVADAIASSAASVVPQPASESYRVRLPA